MILEGTSLEQPMELLEAAGMQHLQVSPRDSVELESLGLYCDEIQLAVFSYMLA